MNFGQAIEALKDGHRVSRAGWNGKGMFLWLDKGSFDAERYAQSELGVPAEIEGVRSELFELGDMGTVTRLPNIRMRSASGATVVGWLASQTDMLAEDWLFFDPYTEVQAA